MQAKKLSILILILAAIFASCKKPDLAGNDATGEGLVNFTLIGPASGTTLLLNAAVPNTTIDITWNASTPGLHTVPTYTWVAALKTGGDITKPIVKLPSNNGGKDTRLTLTYKQLDDALKTAGIADGAKTDFIWSVVADNGSTQLLAQNVFNISISRFKDGASPFVLLAPASSATPIAIDPGSTTQSIAFKWTKSVPAAGGAAIKYKILFVEKKTDSNGNEIAPDFTKPLFTIASNNSGVDSFANVLYKSISDSLSAHGLTNLSLPSNLKWTVVATSGTWSQQSDYINDVVILREVRIYIAGSFQSASGYGNDWTPATAPEMVRDMRAGLVNNKYYTYIYLPANAEFKFTQGRAWDVAYGTGATPGSLTTDNGGNVKVSTAGVYRICINRTTMTYDIQAGRMGLVGGAVTNVGWDPSKVFPTAQMKFLGDNKFLAIYDFTADGWKMIDADHWNNGGANPDVTDPHTFGSNGASGSTLDINNENMPNIAVAGRYRVIWDGTDVNNVKYTLTSADKLYVIGSATVGDWDNLTTQTDAQRPPLTYQGNGVWKGTVTLGSGDIKFIVQKGSWDYSYGGAAGKLGDANITVSAGTYTITVDEYNKTYTIQ